MRTRRAFRHWRRTPAIVSALKREVAAGGDGQREMNCSSESTMAGAVSADSGRNCPHESQTDHKHPDEKRAGSVLRGWE
jgi:hypothetical protein